MAKHRVLLICMLPLLCEGLQRVLQKQEDVELICLDCSEPQVVESWLKDARPGTVLIAGERVDDAVTHLISNVLNRCPGIPVAWIELETNLIRTYTSHTLPANSRGLIDMIRQASQGADEGNAHV